VALYIFTLHSVQKRPNFSVGKKIEKLTKKEELNFSNLPGLKICLRNCAKGCAKASRRKRDMKEKGRKQIMIVKKWCSGSWWQEKN